MYVLIKNYESSLVKNVHYYRVAVSSFTEMSCHFLYTQLYCALCAT